MKTQRPRYSADHTQTSYRLESETGVNVCRWILSSAERARGFIVFANVALASSLWTERMKDLHRLEAYATLETYGH